MAPLYSGDRKGPSRWMPRSRAPAMGAAMASRACPMDHRVCSSVSVRMEQSQPVVPFLAKKRLIWAKSSAVAASWVCRSRKPGTSMAPFRSTTRHPSGGMPGKDSFPSSTSTSSLRNWPSR